MTEILLKIPNEDLKTLLPLFERLGLSFSVKSKTSVDEKDISTQVTEISLIRHLKRIMQEDNELLQRLA